uniref:Uncharacterized protein n=1 Tax=Pseudo-nitzschia australis TaxID=44445 RepID=A0A7S4EJZ9_9STRA
MLLLEQFQQRLGCCFIGFRNSLLVLHLNNNAFTGTNGLSELHLWISSNRDWVNALYELHLHNNAFTGSIPTEIGWLRWLSELHLHNNANSNRDWVVESVI